MRAALKSALNFVRNALIFRLRYPWVRIGSDVHCQWSVFMNPPHRHVVIGNHVGIGPNCFFLADTEIGNFVLIAPCAAFLNSDDHRFDIAGKEMWNSGRGDKHMVVVEDDVWIGHGAIILSPSRIGRGAVVAAGSIVVKDVPRYAVVGGNPARVLKMRFTAEQIAVHERMLGYESPGRAAGNTRPPSDAHPVQAGAAS